MNLTPAHRNALRPDQFAGPGRTYPVNDATHARQAAAMASRAQHAGHLSPAQAHRIQARAHNALVTYDTPNGV